MHYIGLSYFQKEHYRTPAFLFYMGRLWTSPLHLNKWKNEQTETSTVALRFIREGRHRTNHCPQDCRNREVYTASHNLLEQKLMSTNSYGNQYLHRNIWTVLEEITGGLVQTTLRVERKNPRRPSHKRGPIILWYLPPGVQPASQSKYQRKIPLGFW